MKLMVRNIALTCTVVVALFSTLTYVSCKKKTTEEKVTTCNGITCQNGGRCVANTCSCLVGYEGTACDKESMARYLGKWEIRERIVLSNVPANVNKTRVYTLLIRKDGDSKVDMLLDSLMGNGKYLNVKAGLAQRYDVTGHEYKPDVPTKFAIKANQKFDNGYLLLTDGNGSVSDLGNFISATYTVQYKDGSVLVTETMTIEGDFKQ